MLNARLPALFMDRDGVINIDYDFVHKVEEFDFVPGIFELTRKARDHGYRLVVITNQSGIGRGLFTQRQFDDLCAFMCAEFLRQGVEIAGIYVCPWHPIHQGALPARDSYWRKPSPGMILEAALKLHLDIARSVFIGDRHTDILAAKKAGVGRSIFHAVGRFVAEGSGGAEFEVPDLFAAAKLIPPAF
jgi:D-glycero-D-manno-heptose 1,7-bisphosphate phosphatase